VNALTVTRVNEYRVDARVGDKLAAYAIADMWGWALMRRIAGRVTTVQRVDYGTAARRNARVGQRLVELVLGIVAADKPQPKPDPTRTDGKPGNPRRTDLDQPDPGGDRKPAT
jgi:hypothetical protein